tara:strand:- start:447 stop:1097 length:651 start_codon:yes stop_codon:yes gene_type:complete
MGEPARTPRADSLQTRERILDTCERLFGEHGYSGTSVRAIADAAGVNLAAAHYHFGSKTQLLEAVFHRAVAPINAERLRRLDQLQAGGEPLDCEAVVRAFVEPERELASGGPMPRLAARIFAEPRDVSIPLLERTFAETARRFIAALGSALPHLDQATLHWRFHFMVGCVIQLNNFDVPLNVYGAEAGIEQAVRASGPEHLIRFVLAGLTQEAGHE